MKITDYSIQDNSVKTSTDQNRLLEIITATLVFVVPVLTLFLLAN